MTMLIALLYMGGAVAISLAVQSHLFVDPTELMGDRASAAKS